MGGSKDQPDAPSSSQQAQEQAQQASTAAAETGTCSLIDLAALPIDSAHAWQNSAAFMARPCPLKGACSDEILPLLSICVPRHSAKGGSGSAATRHGRRAPTQATCILRGVLCVCEMPHSDCANPILCRFAARFAPLGIDAHSASMPRRHFRRSKPATNSMDMLPTGLCDNSGSPLA